MKKLLQIFVFALLLYAQCTWSAERSLPFFDAKEMTPFWKTDAAASLFTPAKMSEFKVIDQNGVAIDQSVLQKKLALVNFFFAECPGICPTMMKSIQRFQRKLGKTAEDVHIYSFSVKPEHDSPKVLKAYARNYKIPERNWSLLTGERAQIFHVGKDMFKADGSVGEQKSESTFIHTKNIYLVDSKLRIRGIYETSGPKAMELLVSDISQLKVDVE